MGNGLRPESLGKGTAFPAGAGEAQAAGFGAAAGVPVGFGGETFGNDHARQVFYLVAAGADKVDMGFGIRVEAFHTVDGADADDQALLFKERQVPVDRSQGDVRIFRFQLCVYPFGCGMGCGGAETVENRFTLFEMF